jgi:hypothetical protein
VSVAVVSNKIATIVARDQPPAGIEQEYGSGYRQARPWCVNECNPMNADRWDARGLLQAQDPGSLECAHGGRQVDGGQLGGEGEERTALPYRSAGAAVISKALNVHWEKAKGRAVPTGDYFTRSDLKQSTGATYIRAFERKKSCQMETH